MIGWIKLEMLCFALYDENVAAKFFGAFRENYDSNYVYDCMIAVKFMYKSLRSL